MKAAALLVMGLAAGMAQAQPQSVPVCFTDFPPYADADLPEGGSLGALVRRAFAAAGLSVLVIKAPWARAQALAKNGDCLLMTVWRNEERDAAFRYSLPVARMQLGLFVRADHMAPVAAGASIAFQRGSYLPPELSGGRYQMSPVVDMRPAMQMLAMGRVDAVFSERASFEHLLAKTPWLPARIQWKGPPIEVKTAFMAISKSHPQADAWLALLNQEIRRSLKN